MSCRLNPHFPYFRLIAVSMLCAVVILNFWWAIFCFYRACTVLGDAGAARSSFCHPQKFATSLTGTREAEWPTRRILSAGRARRIWIHSDLWTASRWRSCEEGWSSRMATLTSPTTTEPPMWLLTTPVLTPRSGLFGGYVGGGIFKFWRWERAAKSDWPGLVPRSCLDFAVRVK